MTQRTSQSCQAHNLEQVKPHVHNAGNPPGNGFAMYMHRKSSLARAQRNLEPRQPWTWQNIPTHPSHHFALENALSSREADSTKEGGGNRKAKLGWVWTGRLAGYGDDGKSRGNGHFYSFSCEPWNGMDWNEGRGRGNNLGKIPITN